MIQFKYSYSFPTSIDIDYQNIIERGAGAKLGDILKHLIGTERNFAIISDEAVAALHAPAVLESLARAGFSDTALITFPAGERSKSQATASRLIDQLIDAGVHRRTILLALGGGVVCDTVGYVAATFMRGVDYINIPTSLIGQVDASIGGKVAVNHERAKNLIGAFRHPLMVVIDPDFLASLPGIELRNGLAEAVKIAIIASPSLFEHMEAHAAELIGEGQHASAALEHTIAESVRGKIDLLLPDPFEIDLRRVLNFGHTFAHALEVAKGFYMRHGFAVAVGMSVSTQIALNRGLLPAAEGRRIFNLLRSLGLPTRGPPINPREIWAHAGIIRKIRANHVHFVMPTRIGEVIIVDDLVEAEFVAAYPFTDAEAPDPLPSHPEYS